MTVLGKTLIELFDAPVLDVAAVPDQEAGPAYDVLRDEPGFRLTLDRLVTEMSSRTRVLRPSSCSGSGTTSPPNEST